MYRYLLAHLFSNLPRINRGTAIRSASVIFVAIAMSGCGNKGDLYLPEDVSVTYQASGSSTQSYQTFSHQDFSHQDFSHQDFSHQDSSHQTLANQNKE